MEFEMKKKLLLSLLFLSVLTLSVACGNKNKKNDTKEKKAVEVTAEPTNTPLPTAEVSVTENSDGTSELDNKTAGYTVSFDNKLLEMKNTDSTISLTPSDKKAKKELNLFLTITGVNSESTKELTKQLKKSYKKESKQQDVTLGKGKTATILYTITDNKKVVHKVYIVSSKDKGWYIELKCPAKYKKAYLTKFEDILNSIDFSENINA